MSFENLIKFLKKKKKVETNEFWKKILRMIYLSNNFFSVFVNLHIIINIIFVNRKKNGSNIIFK